MRCAVNVCGEIKSRMKRDLKRELRRGLRAFLVLILPFLLIAAVIESSSIVATLFFYKTLSSKNISFFDQIFFVKESLLVKLSFFDSKERFVLKKKSCFFAPGFEVCVNNNFISATLCYLLVFS